MDIFKSFKFYFFFFCTYNLYIVHTSFFKWSNLSRDSGYKKPF